MLLQSTLPHPLLRGWVQGYWLREERMLTQSEEHSLLPERSVRITFMTGQSWQSDVNGTSLVQVPSASMTGLLLSPQRMVSLGKSRALVVELYPWGAKQLLGWEASNGALDLQLRHAPISREICGLLELQDWDGAREQVDHWLLSLLNERGAEPGKGVQAAVQLYDTVGSVRITALAEDLHVSPRQLERQFTQQVGVTPKVLARLIRFHEAYHRIRTDPALQVADLVHELGFFDQAHLIREFRLLGHTTPGAFAHMALQRDAWSKSQERVRPEV